MSKGKYSPALTRKMIADRNDNTFIYNCNREVAIEPTDLTEYDDLIHYGDYDSEGYDYYGYSAWNKDGSFAGHGNGIDRWGYTEVEYLCMSDEEFEDICRYGG
jgi:hypothetical protein